MNLLGLITRSDMVVGEKKKKTDRQTIKQTDTQAGRHQYYSVKVRFS